MKKAGRERGCSVDSDFLTASPRLGASAVRSRPTPVVRRGFTLLETLVVIGIVALILAVLVPALTKTRSAAKSLVCTSNMKSIAMQFRFFAEGHNKEGRGDSRSLGNNRFWINDFLDKMYGLDEFWDAGESSTAILNSSEEPMLCPAGPRSLMKRSGLPCGREALFPVEDVSIAANMRLYRAVFEVKDKNLLASPTATHLTNRVMDHPYVPLVMDVSGREAVSRGVDPFYIAPPYGQVSDPYSTGRYWSPAKRHNGRTTVGFVGGHVLSSSKPEKEHWDWSFQAKVGR